MNIKVFFKRIIATFIDSLIIYFTFTFLFSIAMTIISDKFANEPDLFTTYSKLSFGIICPLTILTKDIFGASIGKIIVGLRIRYPDDKQKNISFLCRILRNITFLIWPVELVAVLITGTRISDMVLNIYVVEKEKK